MLFGHLTTALTCGLALGAAAGLIDPVWVTAKEKKDLPSSYVLHERGMPHWANTWTKIEKVDANLVLPMRIGLKQANLDQGREMLLDISNPDSENFGKHLSAHAVIDLFAPPESSVESVKEWLTSAGIVPGMISWSVNKQWIQFDALTSEVEDLLVADYYVYEHRQTGTQNIACDEYHVPSHIREHIDYITPGIRLRQDPSKVRKLKRDAEGLQKRGFKAQNTGIDPFPDASTLPPLNSSVCFEFVTNQCIRNQYRVPKGDKAAPGNQLGIFESLDDHYDKNDLDVYWSTLYPDIPQGTYPEERLIDGAIGAAQTSDEIGDESDLDFEASWPLIWPQKTVLFQTDDQFYEINQTTENTPYLGFWNTFYDALDGSYCTYSAYGETGDCTAPDCLDPIYPDPNPGGYKGQLQCGVYKPTNVISISYSGGEYDLPVSYTKRQCNEIMKLGLQGVTIVISSGDYGVGSYPGDGGLPNGCTGKSGTVFYPNSDATCPYILAVGSTEFDKNATNPASCKLVERSTTRFPSGGGFSNYFDAPEWQKAAIAAYFDEVHLDFTGYTNPGNNFSDVGDGVYKIGGRGYPDVAAIGDDFVIRAGGQWGRIGGTSLSAPVWAALLTRVNEERLAVGKSTIGFISPILYAHPEVFTDITEGSNPNCNSTGFLAAKGWDPVSGLGSPIYPNLLNLLLHM